MSAKALFDGKKVENVDEHSIAVLKRPKNARIRSQQACISPKMAPKLKIQNFSTLSF